MAMYIPYRKRSKKKKRAEDHTRRANWGPLNPVTRRPDNPKAYNRKKAQRRDKYPPKRPFLCPAEKAAA